MPVPDPVPAEYIRHLCEKVGGQLAASRLLHVHGRTVRKWVAGDRGCPWASAELLRRFAIKLKPTNKTGWNKPVVGQSKLNEEIKP